MLEAGREAIDMTADELEARNREITDELELLLRPASALDVLEEAADDAARAYNTSAPVFREIVTVRARKDLPPAQAAHRAREAERLLGEPLFREALFSAERDLYDQLLNVDPTTDGDELRRSLVDRIRAVREVVVKLREMLPTVREPSRSSFA